MKKFVIILLMVCIAVTYAGSLVSFASSSRSDPLEWMEPKPGEPSSEETEKVKGNMRFIGRNAYELIQEAAFIISAIILLVCGVRIMLSRGNAQKKAEVWDSLKYWVIGSGIAFAVTSVIKILQATVSSFKI